MKKKERKKERHDVRAEDAVLADLEGRLGGDLPQQIAHLLVVNLHVAHLHVVAQVLIMVLASQERKWSCAAASASSSSTTTTNLGYLRKNGLAKTRNETLVILGAHHGVGLARACQREKRREAGKNKK